MRCDDVHYQGGMSNRLGRDELKHEVEQWRVQMQNLSAKFQVLEFTGGSAVLEQIEAIEKRVFPKASSWAGNEQ